MAINFYVGASAGAKYFNRYPTPDGKFEYYPYPLYKLVCVKDTTRKTTRVFQVKECFGIEKAGEWFEAETVLYEETYEDYKYTLAEYWIDGEKLLPEAISSRYEVKEVTKLFGLSIGEESPYFINRLPQYVEQKGVFVKADLRMKYYKPIIKAVKECL